MTAGENAADPTTPTPPATAAERQPLIPGWVRVAVILTVLPLWGIGVLYSMFALRRLPDVAWMAIPSGVIVAVAPAWNAPKRSTRGGGTT